MNKKYLYIGAALALGYYLYQKGYFRALMGQVAYTAPDQSGLAMQATNTPIAI